MAANKNESLQENILDDTCTGISSPQSPLRNILSDDSSMDLMSSERLDRSSPELWPEQIPGVSKFASIALNEVEEQLEQQKPEWLKELDQEDYGILQGFGSLTASGLLDRVRDLQNLAYQLGLEEAKEMTRGRFLGILPKKKDIRR